VCASGWSRTSTNKAQVRYTRWPPHHHIGEASGLQTLPSNQRWRPRYSRKTPRRRSNSPGRARAGQAARGRAQLGNKRSRGRWTEAKQTNPKREREADNQLSHTAMVETAGARRRSSAMPTATRSRQSVRGLGFGTGEERGAQPDWDELARPSPLGLVWPVGPGWQFSF
jgi:hypothetical protein